MFDTDATGAANDGPADDPLMVALQAIREVLAEDRTGWATSLVGDRVADFLMLSERARAAAAIALGGFDAEQGWALDGSASTTAWVRQHSPETGVSASSLVSAARLAHRHDRVTKLLASGDIRCAHVEALGRAARTRADSFDAHADALLDAATALDDVSTFAKVIARWTQLVDDDQARADTRARHDQRHLHTSVTFDGAVAIDGILDPEGGAVLMAALAALDRPDSVCDVTGQRSAAQRRADNLVELAHRFLANTNAAAGTPVATVDVHVDAEILADLMPVDLVHARCDVSGVGPVHPDIARRFLCESWAGRIVLAADSLPLDVGRRSRTFTAAQRRALVAHDGGCVFQGCDRGPQWCDAHHLVPYELDGSTALANGALVCRKHHTSIHTHGWRLTRERDGTVSTHAPLRRRC